MERIKICSILMLILFVSCNPEQMMMPSMADDYEMQQNQVNTLLYNEEGQLLLDFIPAIQPFVNEGCNTAWDNLSAIINPDGSLTYFNSLPNYTASPNDLDKGRFTFIYQCRNPYFGIFEGEEQYSQIGSSGWMMLPIDDYGSMTCNGLQEIRTWVLDELTGQWYMNSQVCWAGYLCNGQGDCNQGWSFDEIEFTTYQEGYLHLSPTSINNQ
jgi:hypothetical protein